MNIVYVITGLDYGGAETLLVNKAIHLCREHHVSIITLRTPKALTDELESNGVDVHSLELTPMRLPACVARYRQLLHRIDPDVVHSHLIHANLFTRIAGPRKRTWRLVQTTHGGKEGGHRVLDFLYRITNGVPDFITSVSQEGVDRYRERTGFKGTNITYVINPVNVEKFAPDARVRQEVRDELGLEGQFAWLAVGRFFEQKNYPNMIRAFQAAAAQRKDARLLIAGKGPEKDAIAQLVAESGLDAQVTLLGVRSDVDRLMKGADAYLMSSAWEGLPIVLLEAAASGLPIVATDVGGNAEVVHDGRNGFLVPSHDSERLARAVLDLMDLPESERAGWAETSRDIVKERFATESVTDQLLRIYRGEPVKAPLEMAPSN
jgi:glycosyltransferase involved in cell wall biosynthesis